MVIGGGQVGISSMGVVRGCGVQGTYGGTYDSVASRSPRGFAGQGDQEHPGDSEGCGI